MAISANTLFHFTQYEYLQKILEAKAFLPRYSFESFINNDDFIVAYPMVCFCDIPLSQIYPHANVYNRNGIGLRKDWGNVKGLNPVFYLESGSVPTQIIQYSYDAMLRNIVKNKKGEPSMEVFNLELHSNLFELTGYYKPRKGRIWEKLQNGFRKDNRTKDGFEWVNFYDEREWRFVPRLEAFNEPGFMRINFQTRDSFYENGIFNEDKFNSLNKLKERDALKFEAKDVKYIIVSKSNYVKFMANFIRKLPNYTEDDKNYLISTIISLPQIMEDF